MGAGWESSQPCRSDGSSLLAARLAVHGQVFQLSPCSQSVLASYTGGNPKGMVGPQIGKLVKCKQTLEAELLCLAPGGFSH